jgi:hypothetical protein
MVGRTVGVHADILHLRCRLQEKHPLLQLPNILKKLLVLSLQPAKPLVYLGQFVVVGGSAGVCNNKDD